jgi:hypothetical protein
MLSAKKRFQQNNFDVLSQLQKKLQKSIYLFVKQMGRQTDREMSRSVFLRSAVGAQHDCVAL